LGRISGPIKIQIGKDVFFEADELKVIENKEPILLIGNDMLNRRSKGYNFCSIGLHPVSGKGVVSVKDFDKNKFQMIEMATYPGMLESYPGHPVDKTWAVEEAKRVEFRPLGAKTVWDTMSYSLKIEVDQVGGLEWCLQKWNNARKNGVVMIRSFCTKC
jgi:hypothetical protein